MSARKLNSVEHKIHQAALADSRKILSNDELERLIPDVNARTDAINFLLSTEMLKVLTDGKKLSFKAVMKKELEVKKELNAEESMVLSHIQGAGNEGVWTKHIKNKTELHQTVLDRSLKSLTQKKLVKSVRDVKHPTRKIYMLFDLEPAEALTGGPWYTDNELDTEFIKLISSACLHFIKEASFPKSSKSSSGSQVLYPIGASPEYPTAQKVQQFLARSKITPTNLKVQDVETLLNVLVLDGEVEKIPAFGASMWESYLHKEKGNDSDEDASATRRGKSDKPKRRKKAASDSESDRHRRSHKKSKKRRRDDGSSDTADSDGNRGRSTGKKRQRSRRGSDDNDSEADARKRSRKRRSTSRIDDSSSPSSSEDDSDDGASRRSRRKRSPSPVGLSGMLGDSFSSAFVYRAVRQDRSELGWAQAPCGRCPVFDFCKDKGPVSPCECVYYEEWLGNAAVALK